MIFCVKTDISEVIIGAITIRLSWGDIDEINQLITTGCNHYLWMNDFFVKQPNNRLSLYLTWDKLVRESSILKFRIRAASYEGQKGESNINTIAE